jgi:hypothetical protein
MKRTHQLASAMNCGCTSDNTYVREFIFEGQLFLERTARLSDEGESLQG